MNKEDIADLIQLLVRFGLPLGIDIYETLTNSTKTREEMFADLRALNAKTGEQRLQEAGLR